ncbi:Gustatory receptor 171 [Halyomorpha halys]|nr:Gustatory receptor 171 [Halyomorpha halys]
MMSTGEVAKFMNNVLFRSKVLSVIPSGKMLKTTPKFYIISFFHQIMTIFIAINAFIYFINKVSSQSNVFKIVVPINIVLSCITLNIIKIFLLLNAKEYQDIFSSILEINLRMKRINPFFPPVYNTFETKVFEALWTLIFLYAFLSGGVYYAVGKLNFVRLSTFLHNTNLNMIHFILTAIDCFVTGINIQLEYIKKNIHPKAKIFTLEQCVAVYSKICNTCLKIEKIFSIHLLLTLSLYFVMLIMHMHFLIMNPSSKNLRAKSLVDEYNLAMIALCSIDILLCAKCFQMLHSNSEKLNVALYEVLIKRESKELLKCKKLLASIYINRRISTTALQFFDVDFMMVQSMISSCTTFIVIMSQFESSA